MPTPTVPELPGTEVIAKRTWWTTGLLIVLLYWWSNRK